MPTLISCMVGELLTTYQRLISHAAFELLEPPSRILGLAVDTVAAHGHIPVLRRSYPSASVASLWCARQPARRAPQRREPVWHGLLASRGSRLTTSAAESHPRGQAYRIQCCRSQALALG